MEGEGGDEGTDAARRRAARTAKEVCELRGVRNFSDAERHHRVFVAPLIGASILNIALLLRQIVY